MCNIKKVFSEIKKWFYSFFWIIVGIISVGISFLLMSSIIGSINSIFNMLRLAFTLGGFSFTTGAFLLSKRKKGMSKSFFELSYNFILSGVFLLLSYLILNEANVTKNTCLGFKSEYLLSYCSNIRNGFAFLGWFGCLFFILGSISLLKHLSKLVEQYS